MKILIKNSIQKFAWLIYLCIIIDILPLPAQWERFEFVLLYLPTSVLFSWAQRFHTKEV